MTKRIRLSSVSIGSWDTDWFKYSLKNFGDSSKLVEGTCDFTRFCTRKSLVLLNFIRQLLWYLALLPIRVASLW
jgi:hypothetical protein